MIISISFFTSDDFVTLRIWLVIDNINIGVRPSGQPTIRNGCKVVSGVALPQGIKG
jgi:hypothetical protein